MHRLSLFVAILALLLPTGEARPQDRGYSPDLDTYGKRVRPFLERHCISCHGPDQQKGKLRLDTINGDLLGGGDGNTWKEVYDKLQLGEMPPENKKQPDPALVEQVADWIVGEMRKAERRARSTGGKVVMRRLNRTEYANTIRDLLHVRFLFKDGPRHLLPPDGKSDGFDKVGKALMIDPSLMTQYMDVAKRIADQAIVTGDAPPLPRKTVRYEYEDTAKSGAIGYQCHSHRIQCRESDLVLMEGGARTWDHIHYDKRKYPNTIPMDGLYKIRVRMSADPGERDDPVRVRMTWAQGSVLGAWALTKDNATPKVFELTLPVQVAGKGRDGPQMEIVNGTRFFGYSQHYGRYDKRAREAGAKGDFAAVKKTLAQAKAEGAYSGSMPNPKRFDLASLPKVILDWIEIEGPIYEQWPPKSHREIFFEGEKEQDLAYVRRIFARLMKRAFRRPVADPEVEPIVRVVEAELKSGESFRNAVKVGLQFVLCSPKFLYLFEPNPEPGTRRLNDFELASRLSYFLWSTMPDGELFRLAEAGRLRQAGVVEGQIRRMLKDPKSRSLVDGFAAQWLQAQKFAGITPNKQLYKNWDKKLEEAAKREPLAFFEEILRNDLSVLNFLDSDFAMLNERLARHYGVPNVTGKEFRRVKLPEDSNRGGLLTQAGVLTIGSDGTRTLPVRRAVWVLETLFNSPPPPPPPNAGEVEPNIKGERLTVRERLLQHQKIASCASCHRKIDPYGLALENYDAVGAWRTRQNGEKFNGMGDRAPAINARGKLPDGRAFQTPGEFRRLLVEQKDRFSRAFTEKLLVYALGRSLEFTDTGAVGGLADSLKDGGYRMTGLITAIVKSDTFQTK